MLTENKIGKMLRYSQKENEMENQGKNHVCSAIVTEYPLRYYKLLEKTNALKREVRTHFKFL